MQPDYMLYWFVLSGASLTGIVLWIMYFLEEEHPFQSTEEGRSYNTRRAARIFGRNGETIVDGQLTGWSESLWRSYEGHYFLLQITEVDKPRIYPFSRSKSEDYLNKYAPPNEAKLLKGEFLNRNYPPNAKQIQYQRWDNQETRW